MRLVLLGLLLLAAAWAPARAQETLSPAKGCPTHEHDP